MSFFQLQDTHLHITANTRLILSESVERIFLNSTGPADRTTVSENSKTDNRALPFYGLHPWNAATGSIDLSKMEELLSQDVNAGIGECGLDFGHKYRETREIQILVFEKQLELAFEFRRPISVHCVRAWGQLIESLNKFSPLPCPFILHSYYGSSETAEVLLNLGGYISLSPLSLRNPERSHSVIKNIPVERVLVETDLLAGGTDFSVDNHLQILKKVYNTVANIKSINPSETVKRIWENGTVFTNSETDRN